MTTPDSRIAELQQRARQTYGAVCVAASEARALLDAYEALEGLNSAIDAMWNDEREVHKRPSPPHVLAITTAQSLARSALTKIGDGHD